MQFNRNSSFHSLPEVAEEKQLRNRTKIITAGQWWFNFALTLVGFAVAIAANIFVKQVANVEIKPTLLQVLISLSILFTGWLPVQLFCYIWQSAYFHILIPTAERNLQAVHLSVL